MIFNNKIIFSEASKDENVDIEELRGNIESATKKMDKIISKSPKKAKKGSRSNKQSSSDTSSVDSIERELQLDNYENENINKQNSNDPILNYEDDSDNLDNIDDRIDYENENDGSDDIDYMGAEDDDTNLDVDNYYDDSEDIDDIDQKIDDEYNNEYAIDGEFDPEDELDDIDKRIDDANNEEFSIDDEEEYEDDYSGEEDPNQLDNGMQQQGQNQPQTIEAEVDPEVSGDPISLPTEGLDDDNPPMDSQGQQQGQDPNLDAMNDVIASGDDQNPMDPNLDPNDPIYDDDSDPLASGGINDNGEDAEAERLKKLVLLNQYRDLINIISDFKTATERLKNIPTFENDEDVSYVLTQLNSMKDKIMFTVEQKFLTAEYTDLLKIYYYFKFGLNSTSKYIEKVVNSKQNNKQ